MNLIWIKFGDRIKLGLAALMLGLFSQASVARVYLSEAAFIQEAFSEQNQGKLPTPKHLWLKGEVRQVVDGILGHRYPKLRLKYWQQNHQTVWILEEIGKERPITFGIVVSQGKVIRAKVLAFRESRGGEIAMPAFEKQFEQVGLDNEDKLNKSIDGISGATMSVNAMKKVTRLALKLHQLVSQTK